MTAPAPGQIWSLITEAPGCFARGRITVRVLCVHGDRVMLVCSDGSRIEKSARTLRRGLCGARLERHANGRPVQVACGYVGRHSRTKTASDYRRDFQPKGDLPARAMAAGALMEQGVPTAQIAERLQVAIGTVRRYLADYRDAKKHGALEPMR